MRSAVRSAFVGAWSGVVMIIVQVVNVVSSQGEFTSDQQFLLGYLGGVTMLGGALVAGLAAVDASRLSGAASPWPSGLPRLRSLIAAWAVSAGSASLGHVLAVVVVAVYSQPYPRLSALEVVLVMAAQVLALGVAAGIGSATGRFFSRPVAATLGAVTAFIVLTAGSDFSAPVWANVVGTQVPFPGMAASPPWHAAYLVTALVATAALVWMPSRVLRGARVPTTGTGVALSVALVTLVLPLGTDLHRYTPRDDLRTECSPATAELDVCLIAEEELFHDDIASAARAIAAASPGGTLPTWAPAEIVSTNLDGSLVPGDRDYIRPGVVAVGLEDFGSRNIDPLQLAQAFTPDYCGQEDLDAALDTLIDALASVIASPGTAPLSESVLSPGAAIAACDSTLMP